jgi:hypothetical protein
VESAIVPASPLVEDLLAALEAGKPALFTADDCRVIANEITTVRGYLKDVPAIVRERDALKAAVDRVRALHTLDGHGPVYAESGPVDVDVWCDGCQAGASLNDDGRCPTLAALEGEASSDA